MSGKGDTPRMILAEELEELRCKIVVNHLRAGQKASGRTASSLRVEVSEDGGTLYGRTAFDVLETGRKGGKVPRRFTEIIRAWMNAKGIKGEPIPYKTNRPHKYTPQQRGDMRLSWFISEKIRKQGTRLFRKGGRVDIYSNEVPGAVERIGQRFLDMMVAKVDSIKINKRTVI